MEEGCKHHITIFLLYASKAPQMSRGHSLVCGDGLDAADTFHCSHHSHTYACSFSPQAPAPGIPCPLQVRKCWSNTHNDNKLTTISITVVGLAGVLTHLSERRGYTLRMTSSMDCETKPENPQETHTERPQLPGNVQTQKLFVMKSQCTSVTPTTGM